jgi:hypothetical protein
LKYLTFEEISKMQIEYERPSNIWEFFISQSLSNFRPIDLLSLRLVSTVFYKAVKKLTPDCGIRRNVVQILTSHPHVKKVYTNALQDLEENDVLEEDEEPIPDLFDVAEKFYEDILEEDLYIFGSITFAALFMKLEDRDSPFEVGDLDLFYPVKRVDSKASALYNSVESLVPFLKKRFREDYKTFSATSIYERLEMFSLYEVRHNDKELTNDIQFSVGMMGKDTKDGCTWRHISRSDLPLQRMFIGKRGLKFLNIESLLGDQICKAEDIKILSHVCKLIGCLRKMGGRLKDMNIDTTTCIHVPNDDTELMKKVMHFITKKAAITFFNSETLRIAYPF